MQLSEQKEGPAEAELAGGCSSESDTGCQLSKRGDHEMLKALLD